MRQSKILSDLPHCLIFITRLFSSHESNKDMKTEFKLVYLTNLNLRLISTQLRLSNLNQAHLFLTWFISNKSISSGSWRERLDSSSKKHNKSTFVSPGGTWRAVLMDCKKYTWIQIWIKIAFVPVMVTVIIENSMEDILFHTNYKWYTTEYALHITHEHWLLTSLHTPEPLRSW